MEDFVKAVQRESDQVADELRQVLDQLEPLMRERRRLEERARALETVMATYDARDSSSAAELSIQIQQRRFVDVAYDILQHAGNLYYEDLLARLRSLGVQVPGRNPGANLIAHMSRDPRFKRVGRGVYSVQT